MPAREQIPRCPDDKQRSEQELVLSCDAWGQVDVERGRPVEGVPGRNWSQWTPAAIDGEHGAFKEDAPCQGEREVETPQPPGARKSEEFYAVFDAVARDRMDGMSRSFPFRFALVLAVFGMVAGTFAAGAQESAKRGRKYKAPPPTSKIEVTVLRDNDGKPIENAAVIFHTLKEKGNMELKSNEDGKALIDVLEIGETVRLQIIAKGFQTFGNDYKIDKDQMAIELRMKRPGEQYSIYKSHPETKQNPDNESPDKPKDDSKPPQ